MKVLFERVLTKRNYILQSPSLQSTEGFFVIYMYFVSKILLLKVNIWYSSFSAKMYKLDYANGKERRSNILLWQT